MIDIEIDGNKLQVAEGTTIIEAADAAGIYIPRFCYHRKLSIAANCRMCLVEVEKSRKPLPACATPVTTGMKILTRSPMAMQAQRSVMEFLLINHPLDCPICDQGGECELQDLSLGFGRACSEYDEPKRSVASEDIGPLIETWMTRCIHCTRCVRFGEEIAGLREMGMTFRGEDSEIGTYVKHFLKSELSGNIIDLCPVGALTNKPARYAGRAWEYREHPSIAPHDGLGSHVFVHTRGDTLLPQRTVMRAVPRENDAINETWASDRDRYSVHGLYHESRVYKPRVKQNGQWVEVSWQRALDEIADRTRAIVTQQGAQEIAALASPSSTVEELYLWQKLFRALGTPHIDHRLREQDFSDQAHRPAYPRLNRAIAEVERLDTMLLVGSNVRFELPLLAHRINKAVADDATVMAVNPCDYDFVFPLADKIITSPQNMLVALQGIAKALADKAQQSVPELTGVEPCETSQAIATKLSHSKQSALFLGEAALNHPQAAQLRALVHLIARLAKSTVGMLASGANAAGAWLAGALPHRGPAGAALSAQGETAKSLLTTHPRRAYFLLNTEPELDCAYAYEALAALKQAGLVVCLTPFASSAMQEYADFILPLAPFTETAGTFINMEGRWQTFSAVSVPHGEARPGWKVLRVLANFLELDGFDYKTAHQVMNELKQQVDNMVDAKGDHNASFLPDKQTPSEALCRLAPTPMYRADQLVRRSEPLQRSLNAEDKGIALNAKTAAKLQLGDGETVTARQGDSCVTLPLIIDPRLADNTVRLPAGLEQTANFGNGEQTIDIVRGQS